jgi:hypothetical protein
MSVRYAVICELRKRLAASKKAKGFIARKTARAHFKELVQAERLNRRRGRTEVQLTSLENAGKQEQPLYGTLLGQQHALTLELIDALGSVTKTYVLRPFGKYVFVDYSVFLGELNDHLVDIEKRWNHFVKLQGLRQFADL